MLNVILFDDDSRDNLLPLTHTRPICELRCGIMTIKEKWEWFFERKISYITQDYLQVKYPLRVEEDNLLINGALLPNMKLFRLLENLEKSEAIISNGELVAARLNKEQFEKLNNDVPIEELDGIHLDLNKGFSKLENLWDLFLFNDEEINKDIRKVSKLRESEPIPSHVTVVGDHPIFVEKGANIGVCIINTTSGPVYIGRDAEIMDGCLLKGPIALCENSVLKMGAKIYGATTVGPHSKVGGEVNNVIFTGFSNKGHDGFLGNSIIGEWCNLGADTNNSNLKNNYTDVKLWNYPEEKFINSGLQFCGLIMGDHSKCGINTMFNTGTVIGVSCNIFGAGFPRNFLPSFSWGSSKGYSTYQLNKAFDTAEKVMVRRGRILSDEEKVILMTVFEVDQKFRSWDKSAN